jgi:SRSO17 transposase
VARQYTGSAGKITNCQVGVFAAYVSRHGHALIDRALYLPREWTANAARLAGAHVPSDVRFATKPQLGVRMIERAIAAGVPFAWAELPKVPTAQPVERQRRGRLTRSMAWAQWRWRCARLARATCWG